MITYLTALTVVWSIGLVIYALLLRPIASHAYNRAYLLLVVLAGLVAPLAPGWSAGDIGVGALTEGTTVWLSTLTVYASGGGGATAAESWFPWGGLGEWMTYGYLLGLTINVAVTGRLLYQLVACFGESRPNGRAGAMLVRELTTADGPFSIGRHLFVKDWSAYAGPDARALAAHEGAHYRLGHTYDRAFVTLVRTVLWFHPLAYLLDRELRLVHEYHADAEALASTELNSYRRLLLAHQLHTRQPLLAAAFAQSPLQNRFAMMTKTFDSKQGWRVALATLAILLTALACTKESVDEADIAELQAAQSAGLSAEESMGLYAAGVQSGKYQLAVDTIMVLDPATNQETVTSIMHIKDHEGNILQSFQQSDGPKDGRHGGTQTFHAERVRGQQVYKIVEVMPHFPDANCVSSDRECFEKALLQNIYGNIRYPKADKDAGIEGKAIVRFVVGTDGEILEPKVIRSPSTSISEEVLRVVRQMPTWVPGKQGGRDVQVSFVLPVQFALE